MLPVSDMSDQPWFGAAPLPLDAPGLYAGVPLKRMIALVIDGTIVGVLWVLDSVVMGMASMLTFGLLHPILVISLALIPLAYHSLCIGGRHSATFGMRAMGIEVRRWDGARPRLAQAVLQTVLFYGTVGMTGSLILLVALFNARRRCLHDFLAGTVVLNRLPEVFISGPYPR